MITERCPPPDWSDFDEIDVSATALAERIDYLMAVAHSVAAGSRVTSQETSRLQQLCRDLELPARDAEQVLAAARGATATARQLDEPGPDSGEALDPSG